MRHSPIQNRNRGSVLVLVLTLLVLLALMGTAFIAVARVDSTAVTGTGSAAVGSDFGPSDKTKINDALSLVTTQVQNAVLNDVFDVPAANTDPALRTSYRLNTSITGTYQPYDHYQAVDGTGTALLTDTTDGFLASRIPVNDGTNRPIWEHVSRWMGVATEFESPYVPVGGYGALVPMVRQAELRPDSISISTADPDGNTRTRVYPSLVDTLNGGGTTEFVAADADGDGVADSMLFRLDMNGDGSISVGDDLADATWGPVRYYGAVRIVDNAAAVNANTAFCRAGDFTIGAFNPLLNAGAPAFGTDVPNFGFFRSNIGLIELFDGTNPNEVTPNAATNDLDRLLAHRLGASPAAPAGQPLYKAPLTPGPADAAGATFDYAWFGDTLEQNLARRVRNPGTNGNSTDLLGAFAPGSAGPALAYRFMFTNPGVSRDPVENALEDLLYTPARNHATSADKMFRYYPADRWQTWFTASLNYPTDTTAGSDMLPVTGGTPLPAMNDTSQPTGFQFRGWRPLVVATNALTNHAPWPIMPANYAGIVTPDPVNFKELMPEYTTDASKVGKTCINTANFGELWRGFWAVLCDPTSAATSDSFPAGASAYVNQPSPTIMRGTTTMTPKQLLLLRAAVAAANAMELRDPDEDITPHIVDLPDPAAVAPASTTLSARVYGTEKQPFITFATVAVDGTMTFRLFNPYKVDRDFPFVRLVRAVRAPGPGGTMTLTDISAATNIAAAAAEVIPAESEGTTLVTIPSGQNLLDAELYLMRTPDFAGANLNVTEWIPLDQFDFRGLVPTTPLNYQRNVAAPWQCVYPGVYTIAPTLPALPRHDAMRAIAQPIAQRTIQLNNLGWPGPNPLAATGNVFPFGGFARDGDILQVPFIGGYRIYNVAVASLTPTTEPVEMNSVTMDAALTSDPLKSDLTGDEEIGRFCATLPGYEFTSDLFDYFTAIQNPKDDAAPNVNTDVYSLATTGVIPTPVVNAGSNASDDSVGVEGRINVNTAPWQVLNMLPLAVNTADGTMDAAAVAANETIATAIVNQRLAAGPYRDLFDLIRRVPELNGFDGTATSIVNPNQFTGDVTPLTQPYNPLLEDGVSGDFESKYAALIRLSNLVSFRSDSFTAYIVVQGWRNAGTVNARLVTERRSAFIIDRSGIRAGKAATTDLKLINVATD